MILLIYMFSFGVNGFGFIACLQDNVVIGEKHKEILDPLKGHVLHPVQFDELYARFHYSDYILQYQPEYNVESLDEHISIEVANTEVQPCKGYWDENIFDQLTSTYTAVYGIETDDILHFTKRQ